jgi:hypothetical protein
VPAATEAKDRGGETDMEKRADGKECAAQDIGQARRCIDNELEPRSLRRSNKWKRRVYGRRSVDQ